VGESCLGVSSRESRHRLRVPGRVGTTLPTPGPGAVAWGEGRHRPCPAAGPRSAHPAGR